MVLGDLYRDILEEHVLVAPFIGDDFVLMSSRSTRVHLNDAVITVMDWLSLDVKSRIPLSLNFGELQNSIIEELRNLPQDSIDIIIHSTHRRRVFR